MDIGFVLAGGNGAEAVASVMLLIWLAVALLMVVGMWKMFSKAGKPGWACLVPIYNGVVLLDIAGKPIWWIILFFIPFVNLIPCILMPVGIARNFGRGTGTALGLIFLGFIFYPILGFGSAVYSPVSD